MYCRCGASTGAAADDRIAELTAENAQLRSKVVGLDTSTPCHSGRGSLFGKLSEMFRSKDFTVYAANELDKAMAHLNPNGLFLLSSTGVLCARGLRPRPH